MSELFELTDRPSKTPRPSAPLHQALLATLENGGAVRIQLNGTSVFRMRNRVGTFAHKQKVRLRMRKDGDTHVIAWLERRS